jgi:hypothetical protein
MIKMAFRISGYKWTDYVVTKKNLLRKYDIIKISASIKDTVKRTGIVPKIHGEKLLKKLISHYKHE